MESAGVECEQNKCKHKIYVTIPQWSYSVEWQKGNVPEIKMVDIIIPHP